MDPDDVSAEISRAAGPWVQSNGGCRAQRTSHGWALVATRKLGQGEAGRMKGQSLMFRTLSMAAC